MEVKHPNLCYPEYSEKLIACVFAKDSAEIDRLLAMARQSLDKEDYEFEISVVIDALRECGENELRLYFWEQIRVSDKGFYISYPPSPLSGKLTTTQKEKIKYLESYLLGTLEKTGSVPHWQWRGAIDEIGYIPDKGAWSHLRWHAENHLAKSERQSNGGLTARRFD